MRNAVEITDYPSLVDAVYEVVLGSQEERGQIDVRFSVGQIATSLNIEALRSQAVLGIIYAMSDLVDYKYCTRYGLQADQFQQISLAPGASTMAPSIYMHPPTLADLPVSFAKEALQFFHERTIQHMDGITFYSEDVRIPIADALQAILPGSMDRQTAEDQLRIALEYLVKYGLIKGNPSSGEYRYHPTLRGACCIKRSS